MKKMFSLALALIMALALCVPAMAAPAEQDGSITVENATVGKDYAGYKLFDVTYSGENMAYTITKNNPFYAYVAGESKLTDADGNELASPFVLVAANGVADTYNVSQGANVSDADLIAWLQNLKATLIDANGSTIEADLKNVTATSATVVWDDVACGYYLIDSGLGATVTVDTNAPNVTIIDKNQDVGVPSKTVDEENVQVGEVVTFTINFVTSNYDGDDQITKYTIVDDMCENMILVTAPVVKVGDVKLTADKYTSTATVGSSDFTIEIPWVDADADGDSFAEPRYESPNTITITYDAKLTASATIDSVGNTNTATISWEDGDTEEPDQYTDIETVYTFALAVKKVDKEGKPLENAVFTLKNGEEAIKMSVVSLAEGDTDANIYVVNPEGSVTQVESPKSGLIIVKGVDSDKYTLTEIAAPNGYNLLADPVEVTPVKTGVATTSTTTYLDADGNIVAQHVEGGADVLVEINELAATPVVVVNLTGTELPSTGGIGTTIFYTVGGLMMAGAAILLVTKKKLANEQ